MAKRSPLWVEVNNVGSEMRVFRIKRLALAMVLGFLLPLSYAFILSMTMDYLGIGAAPKFLVAPFGWPRPLWIWLMGRYPTDEDVLFGVLFMALSNTVVYGGIMYAVLSALALVRKKPEVHAPPPKPSALL